MKEIIYIFKSQILAIKNGLKIYLVKNTSQFVTTFLLFLLILYYFYSNITKMFYGVKLASNASVVIFLKSLYLSLGLFLVCLSFSTLIFSYKNSLEYWNKLKCFPVKSDLIFISSIFLYLMFLGSSFIFLILSIANVMNINILLVVIFIIIFYCLTLGISILTLSIYKIVNLKYKSKFSFYLTSLVSLSLSYLLLYFYFEYINLDEINIFYYLLLFSPLVLGIGILYFMKDKNIEFNEQKEKLIKKNYNIRFCNRINLYSFNVIIEFLRNLRYYIEFLVAPYLIVIIFRILKLDIDYNTISILLTMVAALPIGLYYSYYSCYKTLPININKNLIYRFLLSLILITINYIIFSFIFKHTDITLYVEIILLGLLIFVVLDKIELPILIYGKDNAIFYIIIFLIPLLYKTTFSIFSTVINNYIGSNINENITLLIINLIIIFYNRK